MANREDWYLKNRGEMTFSGYEKDLLFNQEEELFEAKLQQYPNAYDIKVYRYYEAEDTKKVLETRAIVQSLAGYKNINNSRKILARKSFYLRTGDIIEFKNNKWLTTDWVNRQRGTDDYSSLMLCNHEVSFTKQTKNSDGEVDDFGRPKYNITTEEIKLPCYYTTNVMDSYENGFVNLPDNRAKAYIQYTDLLKVGDEINVAGDNYRIYGIDESYMVYGDTYIGYKYGVLILTLEAPVTTT